MSELTPQEALASLFDSDASPIEVTDPERVAEVVVQWLIDSGFKILGGWLTESTSTSCHIATATADT